MCKTFSVKTLSTHYGISPSKIRKMIVDKEIPYHKVGRSIYFDKQEIELWWGSTKRNSQEIMKICEEN